MQTKFKKLVWRWSGVVSTIVAISGLTIGLRYAGWLQPLEWAALDTFFQLRPLEPPDERIVIVGVQESDIQKLGKWPMSDQVLASLLNKIKQQKPRAIGLDIYRDIPVNPGHEELLKVFRSTPNLVGVQKIIGDLNSKIAPPPELKQLEQVSAVDIVTDGDGVVRRGMLYLANDENQQLPSLGLAVAAIYLQKQGITSEPASNGFMKFKQTEFEPFKANDGGYVRADDGGQQILLNYRSPANKFLQVSLMDVLENRVSPSLMRDHIVLIGAQAESLRDFFYTPYSRSLINSPIQSSGVEIHANVASQILSSVLNSRSSIIVWGEFEEGIWIIFWTGLITIIGWNLQGAGSSQIFPIKFVTKILVTLITSAIFLIISSYVAFLISGLWIPLIPPLLASCGSAIVITNYIYINKLRESKASLELKVKERTQELNNKNEQLEQALQQLTNAQEQLIAQERLSFLGKSVQEYGHDLNNPLILINYCANELMELACQVQEKIDEHSVNLAIGESEVVELINHTLELFYGRLKQIHEFGTRASNLVRRMQQRYEHDGNFARELVDLNTLVTSAINSDICHISEDSKIEIKTEYDLSVGKVEIVVEDIRRALINIISNACYAIDAKSKETREEFNPTILIETKNLGDLAQIIITDNGQGIPQEILGRVFERGFTTKVRGGGTGLGLYITQNTIEQVHKGKIEIETVPGFYTKVIIVLPRKAAQYF